MSNRYKHTLHLPRTTFPMRANLSQREPGLLERWQEQDIYARIRARRNGARSFVLHDGPPYANGDIHIGHAVNKILKDMIIKCKTLDGLDARYVPGWDCHGLPIELAVEKKLGKPGDRVSAPAFRAACREYAETQIHRQRRDFQRLGVFADWDHPYLTMDPAIEANIVRALGTIAARGHLYRGERPVYWCMDCASALAEAEVEYAQHDSLAIDVGFECVDYAALYRHFPAAERSLAGLCVPIWTTTPWTLPANRAVALHPELEYVLQVCEHRGRRIGVLLAAGLCQAVAERWQAHSRLGEPLGSVRGRVLEGLGLRHPFLQREVPLVLSEHVGLEAGTGAVHIAPGHGLDDYHTGRRYGLKVDSLVGPSGVFGDATALFAGTHIFKAERQIIEVLQTHGWLLHQMGYRHSYPHCWRHKSPLIFRATAQWFISMDRKGLRQQALQAIAQVRWLPAWGQERIRGMVSGRPDWCISRQRAWGVPIALFIHRQTGALHPRSVEWMETVASRIERDGIEAWFTLDPEPLLGTDAAAYQKVSDTLDVWFDSGVTHASVLDADARLSAPADLYLEGSDQHRGWFQSALLSSVAMKDRAPYKAVLTHGFTVDAQGMKMSKSQGNVVTPQQIIKTLGADILRLWVAATDYRNEMHVSDEILRRTADAYRKLRNTARYLLANLHDFDPRSDLLETDALLELDRWVLARTSSVQRQVRADFDAYRFHQVYQVLHQFCIVDMSGFYLDVIKDRIYTLGRDSQPRRSAQSAMYHVLQALVRWLAPILSFTAEEIWDHLRGAGKGSVFELEWYDQLPDDAGQNDAIQQRWCDILAVREQVCKELESARVAGHIGSSLDAEVDIWCAGAQRREGLESLGQELHFVLISSAARVHALDQPEPGATLRLQVRQSAHPKCSRCWHLCADVGADARHPELCGRCIENIEGSGERRYFA